MCVWVCMCLCCVCVCVCVRVCVCVCVHSRALACACVPDVCASMSLFVCVCFCACLRASSCVCVHMCVCVCVWERERVRERDGGGVDPPRGQITEAIISHEIYSTHRLTRLTTQRRPCLRETSNHSIENSKHSVSFLDLFLQDTVILDWFNSINWLFFLTFEWLFCSFPH